MIAPEEFEYVRKQFAAAEEKIAATRQFELQNIDFAARIESLMSENASLRREKETAVVEKEESVRLANKDLAAMKMELGKSQLDVEHWRRKHQFAEKELEQGFRQYEDVYQRMVSLERERDTLLLDRDRLVQDRTIENAETVELNEKLTRYEREYHVRERTIGSQKEEIAALKETVRVLETKLAEVTSERDVLKEANSRIRATNSQLEESLASEKKTLVSVRTEKGVLQERVINVVAENDNLKLQLESIQHEFDVHREQSATTIQNLQENVDSSVAQISTLAKECATMKERYGQLQERFRRSCSAYKKIIQALHAKKGSCMEAVAALSQEKAKLQRAYEVETRDALSRMHELERTVDKYKFMARITQSM
jgi:DNA repair exonuclease SbcCD ATPase subunit